MNTDEVDTLLHRHAQRWTDRQPGPPPLRALRTTRPQPAPWRSRLPIIAACIAVVVVAAATIPNLRSTDTARPPHSSTLPSGPTLPAAVRKRLIRIVNSRDAGNRGAKITAQAVKTTYHQAEVAVLESSTASYPPPDTPVWVVQIHGDFVCGSCKIPPRFPSPRGHVISLVVTADDYVVTDFALGNGTGDLARLGRVTDLLR